MHLDDLILKIGKQKTKLRIGGVTYADCPRAIQQELSRLFRQLKSSVRGGEVYAIADAIAEIRQVDWSTEEWHFRNAIERHCDEVFRSVIRGAK